MAFSTTSRCRALQAAQDAEVFVPTPCVTSEEDNLVLKKLWVEKCPH